MWAVHNAVKGWTLYNLSLREVQLLINSMSPNEIKLTKVSALNENEWHMLTHEAYPDFFSETGRLTEGFVDYKTIQEQTLDSDTDFFVIRPKKTHHPRLHDRIEIVVQARIEGQNKFFESVTVDVSEGGICFEDTIPDWVSGYFIVRVFDGPTFYQVICSLVEDQKIKKRVQIMSEDSDIHYLKYKEWLSRLLAA